jgi:hypothetical protein
MQHYKSVASIKHDKGWVQLDWDTLGRGIVWNAYSKLNWILMKFPQRWQTIKCLYLILIINLLIVLEILLSMLEVTYYCTMCKPITYTSNNVTGP